MTLQPHAYSGIHDFAAMRFILTEGRKASRHSGYVHTGDLNWWLFYILPRHYDLREIAFVWRDEEAVVGWSLFTPRDALFDLFVHPALRQSEQRTHMLTWTIDHALELARRDGRNEICTEGFADDSSWRDLLVARGFVPDESEASLYTVHSLENIPDPVIPEGFTLRHVEGIHEVDARAAVHKAAFSPQSVMTGDKYRAFMTGAPDYRPELDVITVAPDGRIASFAMAWVDVENQIGLFEPVGTHPDFQRRGLARATLYEALRRMKAAGAAEALVYPDQDYTSEVYMSVGFEPRNKIISYRKAI